ncbi:MAG: hypothetical protein M1834_001242 [Cirrosporium novae-zelandiae]|nr:MAG: hypothetical protein M1834_001242 [Cirrosporium novae-zelandiae]
MERRTGESPMDFEWQGQGPVDTSSPFIQHANNWHQNQSAMGKKRTSSAVSSPQKPSTPKLREPNNQPYYFPIVTPTKPLSSFRTPSFTTPRNMEIDFSSGAEFSSPDNADTEETPQPKPKSSNSPLAKMKLATRNSFYKAFGKPGPAPGRGEVPRGAFSDKVTKRKERKHHKKDHRLALRKPSREHDSHSGSSESNEKRPESNSHKLAWIPAILAWMEAHPHVPNVLARYMQFLLSFFMCSLLMYGVYSFYSTVRSDVDMRSDEEVSRVLTEMAFCAKQYNSNGCGSSKRVPYMETACNSWEECMNKDASVPRARMSAQTFAHIFNDFIETISYKTMASPYYLSSHKQSHHLTLFTPDLHNRHDVQPNGILKRPIPMETSQRLPIYPTSPTPIYDSTPPNPPAHALRKLQQRTIFHPVPESGGLRIPRAAPATR